MGSIPHQTSAPITDADSGLAPAGFQQRRKRDSRERLLSAAVTLFATTSYLAVSVDDIASSAGVSRMTFYRHFAGKAPLAAELFEQAANGASPRFVDIGRRAYHEAGVVSAWIGELFAADARNRGLLRIFTQATAEGPAFTDRAQRWISALIEGLGASIPAFAVHPEPNQERRRWLEAWLLIYEILDQSNHAALTSGVANDPLVIDILAARFLAFVNSAAS